MPEEVTITEALHLIRDGGTTEHRVLVTSDGRRLPLAAMTPADLRTELDGRAAVLAAESATLEPAARLLPELQEFFAEHAEAALIRLQDLVVAGWPADQTLPTVPHPRGGRGVDPWYVSAQWAELDDHNRRILRAQLDLEARNLGMRGIYLAAALGRQAIRSHGLTGGSLDTEDHHLMLGLRIWDTLDPAAQEQLAARVLALPAGADE